MQSVASEKVSFIPNMAGPRGSARKVVENTRDVLDSSNGPLTHLLESAAYMVRLQCIKRKTFDKHRCVCCAPALDKIEALYSCYIEAYPLASKLVAVSCRIF